MASDIRITLDTSFARDLQTLADMLRTWDAKLIPRLQTALAVIGQRWKAEAVKRVPTDTGNLRNRILTEVFNDLGNWTVACGTNVPYGKYLEFGTKFIAGGKVLAIGDNPIVTDDEAVKSWPALVKDGGSREQMPWLRTSMQAIIQWAVQVLSDAAKPPDTKAA